MSAGEPSEVGGWFRRTGIGLGLLANDHYRRDGLVLVALAVRRMVTWRGAVLLVLFPVAAAGLVYEFELSARSIFDLVQAMVLGAALAAGATLFSREREAGTFELQWLATGSERQLLRLKFLSLLIGLLLLAVATAAGAVSVDGGWDRLPTFLFFAMTTSWFVLVVMAYIGTYLTQSWAAGLLGAALLGGGYAYYLGSTTMLNPFLNPVKPENFRGDLPLVANRVFLILTVLVVTSATARRLRRAL